MKQAWIAERMRHIEASGIRKVFDLAATLPEPIDLSIGQPDFDVPEPIKDAAIEAIRAGYNGYTVTQGIAELREAIQAQLKQRYGHRDRQVIVTSGTSGALVLAMLTLVNPGDQVLLFDPYFVMYKHLARLAGGVPVFVDTYPDFRIDIERVRSALTARTKLIVVNTPANPTGAVASAGELRALAELARQRDIAILSDEVYKHFCYDVPFHSPAEWNEDTIVVDGFSKSCGMTGWRLGYVHGPSGVLEEMAKLQQFTFVCAPHPVQRAGLVALDWDPSEFAERFKRRRNWLLEALSDRFELAGAQGAFYMLPRAPWGTGTEFAREAIRRGLLIIPGNVFSERETHFRISYAASEQTLQRGVELLRQLADLKQQ